MNRDSLRVTYDHERMSVRGYIIARRWHCQSATRPGTCGSDRSVSHRPHHRSPSRIRAASVEPPEHQACSSHRATSATRRCERPQEPWRSSSTRRVPLRQRKCTAAGSLVSLSLSYPLRFSLYLFTLSASATCESLCGRIGSRHTSHSLCSGRLLPYCLSSLVTASIQPRASRVTSHSLHAPRAGCLQGLGRAARCDGLPQRGRDAQQHGTHGRRRAVRLP